MAIVSICNSLKSGQDYSCLAPESRYYQQAVIINKGDIAEVTYEKDNLTSECKHRVNFKLKEGKKGFKFLLSESSSSISGTFSSSKTDSGYVNFNHIVNVSVGGVDEQTKCILESLSKGRFVVALQIGDKVEIYGIKNGLSAGDFTVDVQANAGLIPFTLESGDGFYEPNVPFIYYSTVADQEIEDFDADFENKKK